MSTRSLLTFNYSVASDKSWLSVYRYSLQIMPQTTQYITDKNIENYPLCENIQISDSVIHTSYITQPWRCLLDETRFNKFKSLMKNYIKLTRRIKFKYLLIHLPSTAAELNNIGDCMNLLIKIFNQIKDISLLLEIPSFKGGFRYNVTEYLTNIIVNYFDKFVNKNVKLCIDTAHIYANGLDCRDMVSLFEISIDKNKLIDYCDIIHLNGNMAPMYKPDTHCPIFSKLNKMTDVDLLMNYLADKNKTLITENTTQHATYKEWQQFANKYNINIVPFDEHAQI